MAVVQAVLPSIRNLNPFLVIGKISFIAFTSAMLLSGCATKVHKHILDSLLVLQENLRSSASEQVMTLFIE